MTKKIVDASLRVLETLKLLSQTEASIDEIIKHLSLNCKAIYTPEVILKYLNTLRVAGFKVEKMGSKYFLINHPCRINLSDEDVNSIKILEAFASILPDKTTKAEIASLISLLNQHFSAKTDEEILSGFDLFKDLTIKNPVLIEKLEQYCLEKLKLKITYKKGEDVLFVVIEPKEIVYEGQKVFLKGYNSVLARMHNFLAEDIIEVVQLPLRSNEKMMPETTTFKLKGRLAKNYRLRPFERLTNQEANGDLIITNAYEDKEELLKRLFKYGQSCEIISPKHFRTQFIEMLDRLIDDYS